MLTMVAMRDVVPMPPGGDRCFKRNETWYTIIGTGMEATCTTNR
jgi:hypothetical protein